MAASTTRSLRAIRILRAPSRAPARKPIPSRFYSTAPEQANAGNSSGLVGGLVGGGTVFALGYGYYWYSGMRTTVNTANQGKKYIDQAAKKFSEATPEPNEAIEWLRETATSYAAFIPGAKGYVNTAFDDLDSIRSKHGDEVDRIVKETYNDLKAISKKKGASVEAAQEAWSVLEKRLGEIGKLAGDAAEDILNHHPEVKEKVGGNIDQLKQLGDKYGPEAKAQVDKTWDQIRSVVSKGVSADSVKEIQKIVQEKIELLKKMGDEAWKKGMEQAKPYLGKSPKAKELIEKNADALKQGNLGELWDKVKDAANSGNTESLEKFVKSSADKAKSKGKQYGIDVDSYIEAVPGADQIMDKLQKIQEIGKKHGKEAEKILKSTVDEIQEVLSKKVKDAEKLAKDAKDESKD